MNKVIGYVISIVGLALMTLGFGIFKINSGFLEALPELWVVSGGIVLIILGVIISLKDEKSVRKKTSEEVPIYEGRGKNRRIVGYQRE
tara:strand:- start:750 stop:1013 length:264 start_codon:yes stop_codon:yes gene_type:complete